jgi:predicted esterase
MAALTGQKKQFEGDGPYREFSSEIQAVVGSGTVGDMQHAEHSERAAQVYRNLAGARGGELSEEQISGVLKQASPATYVSSDAPPIMLVHGEQDHIVLIPSTDEFVEIMHAAGASICYLRYADGGHAVMFQKRSETMPAMLKFFEQHLDPPPSGH